MQDNPPSPQAKNPKIDPKIAAIILKCMQKDPADRFQSVNLLYEALTGLLHNDAFNSAAEVIDAADFFRALFFRLLDATLDVADRFEIIQHLVALAATHQIERRLAVGERQADDVVALGGQGANKLIIGTIEDCHRDHLEWIAAGLALLVVLGTAALMAASDTPSLFIESDMMDRRVVSEAQLKNRADAFFEGLASRRLAAR